MHDVVVGLIVAAFVFAGGLVGLFLPRFLPRAHLSKQTEDVVRLGTGMLSVLSSLVLGLLIATAKSSYDTTERAIEGYSAELVLLAEALRDYGDSADAPRKLLRQYVEQTLNDVWSDEGRGALALADRGGGMLLERVRESIRALKPVDDGQRWLQEQALQINVSLLRQRWLLVEQAGPTVRPVILGILVSWISFIFVSFGLNAPRNGTVIGAFLICSLAIGGSIFLILQMDSPFAGLLKISSWPMDQALTYMTP